MPKQLDTERIDSEVLASITRLLRKSGEDEGRFSVNTIIENFDKRYKGDLPSAPVIYASIGRLADNDLLTVRRSQGESGRFMYSLPVKRGRGRPRKTEMMAAATQTMETPKRGRGRPRKNSTENGYVVESINELWKQIGSHSMGIKHTLNKIQKLLPV